MAVVINTLTYPTSDQGHPVWVHILEASNLKRDREIGIERQERLMKEMQMKKKIVPMPTGAVAQPSVVYSRKKKKLWNYRVQMRVSDPLWRSPLIWISG